MCKLSILYIIPFFPARLYNTCPMMSHLTVWLSIWKYNSNWADSKPPAEPKIQPALTLAVRAKWSKLPHSGRTVWLAPRLRAHDDIIRWVKNSWEWFVNTKKKHVSDHRWQGSCRSSAVMEAQSFDFPIATLRIFQRAVQCIAKLGKDAAVIFRPDQLVLRGADDGFLGHWMLQ